MGLYTSHGCWNGAYSAFSRWRDKIAKAAGYISAIIDYGDGFKRDTILIDWGHITDDQLYGEWEKTPDDPLLVLIAHSDCEGSIYPEQAGPLADRLEAILPLLEGDGGGHIGSYKEKTAAFIAGLRLAAERNEIVEFH
jgi:hypothetical protein